ncbi:hypothetical protein M2650_01870 [Luteimonas sp. SX5]|uniref:DUF3011 domain-containing protein n=1 Tax=Luteimonas galliterrae TaxID=2940486 RepID=A0ABT0MET9_9GAMM|nr:hypothetical protein [Luteimonas galliterrae]MCL1633395.1 hypothetical protein [Luteimonas galliterrae]
MNVLLLCNTLIVAALATAATAHAGDDRRDDPYGRYDREWKSETRDGPCRVKRERKGDDSLLEVKCKDGYGARWRGEWKDEFRDGPCVVKIDAKRDEYKEEIKCE